MGVTFDFKVGGVDSADANYASAGPGSITFVQDPSLEGDAAGVLTLDFAVPTSVLSFGYALLSFEPLPAGVSVTLLDSGLGLIGVFEGPEHPRL